MNRTKETSPATNQRHTQILVFANIRNKDQLLHRIANVYYSTIKLMLFCPPISLILKLIFFHKLVYLYDTAKCDT